MNASKELDSRADQVEKIATEADSTELTNMSDVETGDKQPDSVRGTPRRHDKVAPAPITELNGDSAELVEGAKAADESSVAPLKESTDSPEEEEEENFDPEWPESRLGQVR